MVSATDTDVKRLVWSALAAPVRPQTYKNLLYVSLAFPLGLAYFVFVSVTVPLSIALLILVVGLPLLILTVGIALGLAGLERRLTRVLLDVDVPGVRELDGDSRRERLFGLVTDRPTLTTLVYLPSKLFVGLASAIVVVTTFSTGVAMLFVPLYYTEPGLYVGVVSNRPVELHPALYVGWNNLLVGFETVVEFIADETDADLLTCGYKDEREALTSFADRVADGERGTAVLMGDPNHSGYQFVGKVQDVVDRPVRVIPGISSLQIAASRARTPMEDTEFVTLHKSGDITADIERLTAAVGERHLLVLPRPFDWMPGDIAAHLLDHGADPELEALVLEKLTHDDESITRSSLGALCDHAGGSGADSTPFSDLSVLAVRREVA